MSYRIINTYFCMITLFLSSAVLAEPAPIKKSSSFHKPYNIILIINDQETFHLAETKNYRLPAREAFHQHGITFTNHYTAAAMCSPSRASFLTGMPPQVHGVYDQEEYNYVPDLTTSRPNMGSVLKSLGYYTAYFGKFEMNKKLLIAVSDKTNYSTLAQPYGFDTFNPDGDAGGNPQQGYTDDPYFVGEAIRWLRANATPDNKSTKPFFMVISLLNPHDIMYGDANLPDTFAAQNPQANVILPPPTNSIYSKKWEFHLPTTLEESLTADGMPNALQEYQKGWAGTLGYIPTNRTDMWTYYYNYYLNAIQDSDKNLQQIVNLLNELNLWDNTIIIVTADHGEMGGAHGGLRGKGPMAYEENVHIPLIIDHPDAPKGVVCKALTSHLDLLPTMIGLTERPFSEQESVKKNLPGHDFSKFITQANQLTINAIRPAILFNYVGISTIDGNFLLNTLTASLEHKNLPPLTQVNLSKRGFISMIFNGRYKFARFYSPNHFNMPQTLQEILENNDTQLFDLELDPKETHNLMLEHEKYKALILQMNGLLNDLIKKEVGDNYNNKFLPLPH